MKQEKQYNIPNCIVGGGVSRPLQIFMEGGSLLFNKISSFLLWSKGGTI